MPGHVDKVARRSRQAPAQRKRAGGGAMLADNRSGTVAQREERANHTGLPDNLKSGIEHLSGMSMDHVRVHYNSPQPAQLNAHAYAQGSHIHVAPGQERHLPHEAWHVVQQAQGRVKPTMQMKNGVPVNDHDGLEREADVMGARSAQLTGSALSHASGPIPAAHRSHPVAQLRHITEISYQRGTLGWRGNNTPGPATNHQPVGIGTTAFLDPQDPEQGERTGAAGPGTIYAAGGHHYAVQNGGHALTQGHLLNANLGGKAQPFNLFPITAEMNRAHSGIVEDPVKYMVRNVHQQRATEGSLGAVPFAPGGGLATGAGRAAAQVAPASALARVNAVRLAVQGAVNGYFAGIALPVPMAIAAAIAPVAGDNTAHLAHRILAAAAAIPGVAAAQIAGLANAFAGALGAPVGPALAGAVPAAAGAFGGSAAAAAGILSAAIGGGAVSQAGLAGTLTATPDDIRDAFAATPAAGLLPGPSAFAWDHVRVYYSVRVTAPGINGAGVMMPNNLRQEQFHCRAAYTAQDGITPNLALPHINAVVQAPHDLNSDLAALGFGPHAAPQGLVIGPAIAPGGGAGGAGAPDAPSEHTVQNAHGAVVGHATLFSHS